MQTHVRQGNKAQSIERVPRAKQFACVVFAVLLAFSIIPTGAFQPASAYANEVGAEVDAEGGAEAGVAGTEGIKCTGVDAQGDLAVEVDAGDVSGEEVVAEGAANAEADAPGDEGAEGVEANTENDAAIVITEDSAEGTEGTGIVAQSDVGAEINVDGAIRISGAIGPDPDNSDFNKYDYTFERGMNKVCIDRSAFNGYAYASISFDPTWDDNQNAAREAWEKLSASQKYTPDT